MTRSEEPTLIERVSCLNGDLPQLKGHFTSQEACSIQTVFHSKHFSHTRLILEGLYAYSISFGLDH